MYTEIYQKRYHLLNNTGRDLIRPVYGLGLITRRQSQTMTTNMVK